MRVTRLHLTDIHPDPSLPWATGVAPVYAYLIDHPGGLILIDTGVGQGNELIDTLYQPEHYDLTEAIARGGHRIDEVQIIINSHLHFDHCGQNRLFPGVPILVQRREYEAAHQPYYTDLEWVNFRGAVIEQIDGDHQVARGVKIISTPGHTPGHQSVVIESEDGNLAVCAQAAYTAVGFAGCETDPDNTEDEDTQRRSIQRLRSLGPTRVYFSHDPIDRLTSATEPPRAE